MCAKAGLKRPAEPNNGHCDRATNPASLHSHHEAIGLSSSSGYFWATPGSEAPGLSGKYAAMQHEKEAFMAGIFPDSPRIWNLAETQMEKKNDSFQVADKNEGGLAGPARAGCQAQGVV